MRNIEIKDKSEIEEIIKSTKVCHVAVVDDNMPYVFPMNFGYENNVLYLHSAPIGRKIDIMKKNNSVSISMEKDSELYFQHVDVACSYAMKFRSVILFGKISFISENDEKIRILNIIMNHYTNKSDFKYNKPAIDNVAVMRIDIEHITARKRGYC